MTERGPTTRLDEAVLEPLVRLAMDGELDAFERLVRMLQGPLRSFCRRMMNDDQMGDDAAQETLVRIWRNLPRHEPRGKFVAWTFTIARNTSIELLRREKRTPVPAETVELPTADEISDIETREIVQAAIAALDEPYRSTFLLRETGLAYDEVAAALDCPIGTVRSRLHEARSRLTERLRPLIEDDLT